MQKINKRLSKRFGAQVALLLGSGRCGLRFRVVRWAFPRLLGWRFRELSIRCVLRLDLDQKLVVLLLGRRLNVDHIGDRELVRVEEDDVVFGARPAGVESLLRLVGFGLGVSVPPARGVAKHQGRLGFAQRVRKGVEKGPRDVQPVPVKVDLAPHLDPPRNALPRFCECAVEDLVHDGIDAVLPLRVFHADLGLLGLEN